jgi:NADH:ubiquinone oxidoreductase subunit 5 (subunit L)/multisubunit Na+/H+ antiporter MnhA subunit
MPFRQAQGPELADGPRTAGQRLSKSQTMYNVEIVAPVVVSVSFGSGLAAGLFATRYFRADDEIRRYFAFWPTFWVVSILVFALSMIIVLLIFGGPPEEQH